MEESKKDQETIARIVLSAQESKKAFDKTDETRIISLPSITPKSDIIIKKATKDGGFMAQLICEKGEDRR